MKMEFKKGQQFKIERKSEFEKLPQEEGVYEIIFVEIHRGYKIIYCIRFTDNYGTTIEKMLHVFDPDKETFKKLYDGKYLTFLSNPL